MSKNTMNISRKIQLIPVGNKEEISRVYTYLREGMKAQNLAMNQYMSSLYATMMMEATKEDRYELNKLYTRIYTSKKGSAYDEKIVFAQGLNTTASLKQKVKQDFDNANKKGLKYGKISLPTYKDTNPLLIPNVYIRLRATNPTFDNGLYHNYKSHTDFLDKLYDKDLELFIKFVNNITFQIILGQPHNSSELRSVFKNIFEEYYQIKGSSIELKGTKIILNMSIEIPKKKIELDENVVVGVDLGQKIPSMCALNTNDYIRKSIGSDKDFRDVRNKIKAQRERLQKNLAYTSGGHGYKKKMKPMDRFTSYEKNWVKTYNHWVSKQVVDFAIKNKAKYINLEDLSGFGKDADEESMKAYRKKKVLSEWSYYQLQTQIQYKAEMYGIEVRFVNAAYTSQKCSCCGNTDSTQRKNQSDFICNNPKCVNYGKKINADFNAARNISMSTEFVDKEEKKTKSNNKKTKQKTKKAA